MTIEYLSMFQNGVRIIKTSTGSYLVGPNGANYNDKELKEFIGLNEAAIKISDPLNMGNITISPERLNRLRQVLDEQIMSSDLEDKVSRSLDTKILPDERS
ncbi:MAG: hypothetical protein WC867_06640 [Candidatus Pacearchaeota archaeon]|jgi:hypothetical protein